MSRRRSAALALLALAAVIVPVVPSIAPPGGVDARGVVLRPAPESVVDGLLTGDLSVPDLGAGAHRVRVGVVEPRHEPTADVLFLHGHADRLDNHPALFAALRDAGVRVVSFDLPSHGLTDAGAIDLWSVDDLARLASRVERATAPAMEGSRPLILAGWSFGGLVATRIAQDPRRLALFDRPVAGLALEAPALAPRVAAGGDGVSRLRALTHDLRAPVAGPPSPPSPLQDPVFAGRLLLEAQIASARPLPPGLPTLVELSDPDDDLYIDPSAVARWADGVGASTGASITVRTCPGARHGLDFESFPVGDAVRSDVVDFVTAVASGRVPSLSVGEGGACR